MSAPTLIDKLSRIMRYWPLYGVLRLAGVIGGRRSQRWGKPKRAPWQPGVAVLIPESGTPDLLAETLAAVEVAIARIDEPTEIVVVVNGAARADYDALVAAHPRVRWSFHAEALGYNGAVVRGLRHVRLPSVYLLNSDMRVEPDALAALLPYRLPEAFAATSQIFFADSAKRREETGWSDFHLDGNRVVPYEREPDLAADGSDAALARGNLYPGGGSSLCRTEVLRRYARGSACYSPFYWEDTDWGVRAWSDGWAVLFVPASRVHHHHRGTVRRYFDAAEVERVIARNQLLFELRHHFTALTSRSSIGAIEALPERSRREILAWRNLPGILARRAEARVMRRRGLDFATVPAKFFAPSKPAASAPRKPRVLLVTPFALFPPAHGGARRVAELVRALSDRVDFVLLTDEASAHTVESRRWFAQFEAVHVIEGRGDQAGQPPQTLDVRIARHAHRRLRAAFAHAVALHDPDIVQVEFVELAALVEEKPRHRARWVLALHDVYLDGGAYDALQRRLIAQYDAVTVCSTEDAALLRGPATDTRAPHARLVANGAVSRLDRYIPSPAAAHVLFMGPFRYGPNRIAIETYLREVHPRVLSVLPDAKVTILGGVESNGCGQHAPFDQPGVELVSHFVDPAPYLERCALTINPQLEIRGSALKLVESLLAGRICVSTEDGARGFRASGLHGLVTVPTVDAMLAPLLELLRDPAKRHALERSDDAAIAPLTWNGSAAAQLAVYRDLLR